MIKLLFFLASIGNYKTVNKFEPCHSDFSLLKEKARVELGVACSTVNGNYTKFYRKRLEIWKNGKKL